MPKILSNLIATAKTALGKDVTPNATLDVRGGVSINDSAIAATDPGAGNLAVSGNISCAGLLVNGVAPGGGETWDFAYENAFLHPAVPNGTTRIDGTLLCNASNGGISLVNPSSSHLGVGSLTTGTSNAGRTAVMTDFVFKLGGANAPKLYNRSVIAIPVLSDSAERFGLQIGFSDNFSTQTPAHFLGFRYLDSISPNFLISQLNASISSNTNIDTGVAVQEGAFDSASNVYVLEAFINYTPGIATFAINGISFAPVNINIAAATNFRWVPIAIVKSTGATARTVQIDHATLKYKIY